MFYILKDRQPVETTDIQAWAEFMAKADRQVARTNLTEFLVSTVFLGMGYGIGKPILLFETMVFTSRKVGTTHDSILYEYDLTPIATDRYETFEDAMFGHNKMVDRFNKLSLDTGLQPNQP